MIINKKLINKEIIKVYTSDKSSSYLVRDLPDAQKAADKLNNINNKIMLLINYLKNNINKFEGKEEEIMRLLNKYNGDNLLESHPNAKYTSYSVNKGEKIAICLRDKFDDIFEDENIVMFVVIHELAHVMNKTIGHDEPFWRNMAFLLKYADKEGVNIYSNVDYSLNPVSYCGMEIKSNPVYSHYKYIL